MHSFPAPPVAQQVYQMPFYHLPVYAHTSNHLDMECLPHGSPCSSLASVLVEGAQGQGPLCLSAVGALYLDSRASLRSEPHLVLPKDILSKKECMGGISESLHA